MPVRDFINHLLIINAGSFLFLNYMDLHILHLGILKAKAEEMIRPLTIEKIAEIYEVDSKGYISLALNALLLIEGGQVVLIDPGCADFLPARIMHAYGLEVAEPIESVLEKHGLNAGQVTDVLFTHLHFDHGSGAFKRQPGKIVKRFPNAKYHVWKDHYHYASRPDASESNSFFTTFFKYLDRIHWLEDWSAGWLKFRACNGHTRGMVVPVISTEEKEIIYLSDLIPMQIFLQDEIWCGFDLDPDLARSEKLDFLGKIRKQSELIFFHDTHTDRMFYP
jgi:glyoxylase-like metal-dependent hydrolase (beta-lactamase superfamily II)